ncbi:MAG: acyl-CoA dehydrogenase family protein [SAR324 cluster bacterium]|nr:acyl-CoA dehydrogenase family protein [SAR324 cluster bacterium]
MDLRESPELGAFRKEVRQWVLANLPKQAPDPRGHRGLEEDEYITNWFKTLAKKNWLAFRWPQENGGAGFNEPQQLVFVDELMRCGAQVPRGFGISMVGPLIFQYGTDWQKERFLPPIAAHEEIWCQGYSEPNSGSDLASLQTRAELDGDHFIVNGQKTWTSRADAASWIFALVRTSTEGKKQEGISFLLIDMSTPGVSIKPIRQIDGNQGFFETFFDDVKVPVKNMVGEMNKGWTMAKALLGHERVMTGANVDLGRLIGKFKSLARQYERQGHPVLEDAGYRDRLTQMEMDTDCLLYTRYRMNTAVMKGQAPGPESSIFKVFQAELCQRLYDLGMDTLGPDSAAWYDARLSEEAYDIPMGMTITRAMSIYSGSNEIQRNIIAKRVLNLPD